MKPRHLIFIVLIGASLIAVAPTSERAGQTDNAGTAGEPAQDVTVTPPHEVKVEPHLSKPKSSPPPSQGDAGKLKQ